jgi:hypothetical protein
MNNQPNFESDNPTSGGKYYHGYSYYPQFFDNSVNKYYHYIPYYNHYYDNSNSFYDNRTPGFDFSVNPNITTVGRAIGTCLLPESQRKTDVLEYKQRNTLNSLTKQQKWAQLAKGINNTGKKSWSSQSDTISISNTSSLYEIGNTLTCYNPSGGSSSVVVPPPPPPPPPPPLPPSYTETPVTSSVLTPTIVPSPNALNWSISSSYDMKTIVVSMYNDVIYASYNYGVTWYALTTTPSKWSCITSSRYATTFAAGYDTDYIYISTDASHNIWTAKTASTNQSWRDIKISGDGSKMVAVTDGNKIFMSFDNGNTWTTRESNRSWKKVAISFDGSIIAAVELNGYIYVSYDGGNNWINRDAVRLWQSICMSDNGLYMCAVSYGDTIYISNNYGNTWTSVEVARNWIDVVMSSDGSIISALDYGGTIHISKNYGVTWSSLSTAKNWFCQALSSDGTRMTSCVYNEYIYLQQYF